MPTVQISEHGDRVYIVGPATVYQPSEQQMTEFAFTEQIRKMAPNPNLLWMHGQYVEADIPNGNGALWQSKELAIASLTPMFMPVNVMHEPSLSVGLIANVDMKTPDKDNVVRAKIESDLAVWKHLHPDVAEECAVNAQQNTLMQSMECFAPSYSCGACGTGYMKQPDGAEEAGWCAHLKGDGVEKAARILERVVFTGVGLIFGTRGREGADPNAYLTMEEVASRHQEAHDRAAHRSTRPKPDKTNTRSKITVADNDISLNELADLKARPTRDELAAVQEEKRTSDARVAELEKELTDEKAAHEATKNELDGKKTELTNLSTEKAAAELKTERVGALGDAFLEALGDDVAKRLTDEQAAKLSDDDWKQRVAELAKLVKVESTAKKDGSTVVTPPAGETDTRTPAELAALEVGNKNNGNTPAPSDTATVIGDLVGL